MEKGLWQSLLVPGVLGLAVPAAGACTHPPGSAKAGPGVEGSVGGPWGPMVCCWSPTDEISILVDSGILASSVTGRVRVLLREIHFHVIQRGHGSRVRVVLRRILIGIFRGVL